jgi:hypothetical protein
MPASQDLAERNRRENRTGRDEHAPDKGDTRAGRGGNDPEADRRKHAWHDTRPVRSSSTFEALAGR